MSSYFTQMAGLAYHNFASAAVGIVLAIAVFRGIARRETDKVGNFWVDTTRCLLWASTQRFRRSQPNFKFHEWHANEE